MMRCGIPDAVRCEAGQSLVEYALLILLVAIVVVTGLTVFGTSVDNLYQTIVAGF